MNKQERVRACYLHACLRYVTHQRMTNRSLRERFGIGAKNAARVSRVLSEAQEAGVVAIEDEAVGTRRRRYLPFWAACFSSGEGG